MKCPYCGYEYKEYITYCINCNAEIKHEDYLNSIVGEFNKRYENINSLDSEFTQIYHENINTEEIKEFSKDYINKEISAEQFAIKYYKQKGYSAFFAENEYWHLLYLLIYEGDKLWGHNLYSMLFWGTFSIKNYDPNEKPKDYNEIFGLDFKNYVVTTYFDRLNSIHDFEEVNEIFNNGKTISDEYYNSSSYLFPIDDLLSSVNHLNVEQLKLIFERINKDFKYYSKGFPDLIVYNDKEFFLVEVKSKKDNLSLKQTQWLKFLSEKVKIKVVILTIDKSENQIENIKNELNNSKELTRKKTPSIKTDSNYDKILLNPKTYSFTYWHERKEFIFINYTINHSSGKGNPKYYFKEFVKTYNEETGNWEPENEIESFFSLMDTTNKKIQNTVITLDKRTNLKPKDLGGAKEFREYYEKIFMNDDVRYDRARKIYYPNVLAEVRTTKEQLERNKKAKLLEEMNDLEEAIKLYELNVSEKTGSPTTYKRLCKIYERFKKFFRIKEVCDIAIPIFIYLNDKKNTLYFLKLKLAILHRIETEIDRKYGYSSKYYKLVTPEENDCLYEKRSTNDSKRFHKKIDEMESRKLPCSIRINYK